MTTNPRSRALNAALTGLTTAAYYAVPDVTPSRAARGWLKAACLVAGAALTAAEPESRDGLRKLRSTWREGVAKDDALGTDDAAVTDGAAATDDAPGTRAVDGSAAVTDEHASASRKTAVAVVGVALLAASTALTVAGEKWLFRRGEARAAAGVRFAHTRTGLALGALSVALSLVPDPSERA
ncbi:MAG: hypothetical protein IR158_09805 [Cellulomonas sp.]|uniref:hypothetical protein n=1 Tax=Cellulomonas sp. TaxID=40001 RepID=UPI0019DB4DFA|nr:hypothetical protein [Cellulomonas sp.]MBF0688044.1 hypothetical protein [Cellulomonas sp.]